MRIAVTYQDGQVFQHFGHTERFKVYDVEDGEVVLTSVVNMNGSGHGALADLLRKGNVTTLICGGIGAGARRALTDAGIALYGGVSGSTDDVVNDFLAGRLDFDPEIACEHQGEHRYEGQRDCGQDGQQRCFDP